MAPQGEDWDRAVASWRTLATDEGADLRPLGPDRRGRSRADASPGARARRTSCRSTGAVPDPDSFADPAKRDAARQVARLYGPRARTAAAGRRRRAYLHRQLHQQPDRGSARRRRSARAAGAGCATIRQALVVPGSGLVKRQAEAEGLDRIFIEAGFEWREPGCSMCLAMNPDKVPPRERCASTSNRNFVGRQGPGRAHASDVPGHGRGGGGDRAPDRRPRADGRTKLGGRGMTPFTRVEGRAYPLAARQCRHRPHHPAPSI